MSYADSGMFAANSAFGLIQFVSWVLFIPLCTRLAPNLPDASGGDGRKDAAGGFAEGNRSFANSIDGCCTENITYITLSNVVGTCVFTNLILHTNFVF